MIAPSKLDFDYYFDSWVNREQLDERSMYITYLKVLDPSLPSNERKYQRRKYRKDNYMNQFKDWASVYYDRNFVGRVWQSQEVFLNEFERDMMTLLCSWEENKMDHGNREIRDKNIQESQIVNDDWICDKY